MKPNSSLAKRNQLEKAGFAPVPWHELVGYEEAKQKLQVLKESDRFPPVLLVEGREGSGKRVFAAYLAALFWCQKQSNQPCGHCGDCRSIQSFSHQEVFWIESDDGKSLKIEHANALHEHLTLMAQGGSHQGWRIVVIVDVDLFNRQGANRLLKIFEEPPLNTLIIMTSSRPGHLLSTTLSRLFRYRVKPPSLSAAAAWLEQNLDQRHSRQQIENMLAISGRSIGLAKSRLEAEEDFISDYQGLADAFWAKDIEEKLSRLDQQIKQRKLSANELAMRLEVILNQYYKTVLGLPRDLVGFDIPSGQKPPRIQQIHQWREMLMQVKRLSGGQKIALNALLAGESWALI